MSEKLDSIVDYYKKNILRCEQFQASVKVFFEKHEKLNAKNSPVIHSIKTRLKNSDHLLDKLIRKTKEGKKITKSNLFLEITDLIGVRVLHLYPDQFPTIHKSIMDFISEGDWTFVEDPMAYTWDPESKQVYDELRIENKVRETYYTSVHYIVKPNNSNPNPICCEIQVRTLFEEIWGEIDHSINYPHPTESIACREQLRVLSKLVSTGTRLADSIYRTHNEHSKGMVRVGDVHDDLAS